MAYHLGKAERERLLGAKLTDKTALQDFLLVDESLDTFAETAITFGYLGLSITPISNDRLEVSAISLPISTMRVLWFTFLANCER